MELGRINLNWRTRFNFELLTGLPKLKKRKNIDQEKKNESF